MSLIVDGFLLMVGGALAWVVLTVVVHIFLATRD